MAQNTTTHSVDSGDTYIEGMEYYSVRTARADTYIMVMAWRKPYSGGSMADTYSDRIEESRHL